METQEAYKNIINGLQQYFSESGFKKGVLGVSGGLDSAVTLKLAVEALGAENVTGLLMPENGITAQDNMMHAKTLCEFLRVQTFTHPINAYLMNYVTLPWKQNNSAYINTKARVRATILYSFANTYNALVIGTSNKSELMLGYGTKHGDLAADILPLGDLYKTQVKELAEFLDLPKEITEKIPTAELYKDQTDEAELGGTYSELDIILKQAELGEEMLIEKGMNPILVRKVFQRMRANAHKLQTPPIITISNEI
jgi:NAD+ synthase